MIKKKRIFDSEICWSRISDPGLNKNKGVHLSRREISRRVNEIFKKGGDVWSPIAKIDGEMNSKFFIILLLND